MAKYEVTVKVPASANGPRIPRRVTIEAKHPVEAIQLANGQYGAEHVIQVATKVSD
jgi:hypothetical protein